MTRTADCSPVNLGEPYHWKHVDDDGRVVSVYRRSWVDGLLVMERYTWHRVWSPIPEEFFRPIEDPEFVELEPGDVAAALEAVDGRWAEFAPPAV